MPFGIGSSRTQSTTTSTTSVNTTFDKSTISDLVAQYGSSSATAWLEFDRYKIWQPVEEIPQSTFKPIQGYMQHDPYVFAWGNPLVSDRSALEPTAKAFVKWVEAQGLQPVWSCVDEDLERLLGGPSFGWCTVSCIYEDVLDPAHVIDITSENDAKRKDEGSGASSLVKDLKKNLRRAAKANVEVSEVKGEQWTQEMKKEVEAGIEEWRGSKSGLQIASTTVQPWLDEEHRRYWIAAHEQKLVGILILTPIKAPKGTSEALIHGALQSLNDEQTTEDERVMVTFGTTASDKVEPIENLSGWRVNALAKTYGKVAKGAGLLKRGDFRNKFDSNHAAMYVCYPDEGFGLDGVNALLRLLRK